MKQQNSPSTEGILRQDAGRVDAAGFMAPSIGALEHALYFTTAPSVIEKAKQVLQEGRLLLPGAVVVWDETIGRRKGAKAVPKSWWAGAGSLTVTFALLPCDAASRQVLIPRTAAAVVRVLESFKPCADVRFQPPNDIVLGDRKVGVIHAEVSDLAELVSVRLNCVADFANAPAAVAAIASRLIDFIDVQQLPLQKAGTLPNTVLTRLMTEIPREFASAL